MKVADCINCIIARGKVQTTDRFVICKIVECVTLLVTIRFWITKNPKAMEAFGVFVHH